jgi:hypothetical protein
MSLVAGARCSFRGKDAESVRTGKGRAHPRPLWPHQQQGFLRAVYTYEILYWKNELLNIVTGGGKTAIIAKLQSGRVELRETKGRHLLKESELKFDAARGWCTARDMAFVVITKRR